MSRHLDKMWKCMFTAVAFAILGCTLSCAPYRPVEPLPQEGIVDMHCHIAGIGAGGSGCLINDKFRENWRFRFFLKGFGVTEEELWENGDDLLVDRLSRLLSESKFVKKAVVLAMDGVVTEGLLDTYRTQVYVPNEFVVRAVARYDNLLFGASVNPYRKDALDRLVWAKAHGAVLIKWIPSVMNIDPSDEKLKPFYKKLVELNLPLLTHAGKDFSFPSVSHELADPEKLDLPLRMGVKVIAAHIASTGSYRGECSTERLVRMMRRHHNLYADISALTQINRLGYMKKALTQPAEFSGRLFYGSDFPLINTILVSPWYYLFSLPPWQISDISSLTNPWDVDVKIKQALGIPTEAFARSQELLHH